MKFAPREIFDQILEWSVIPTFDLIIEVENRGYVLVKRKIAPYMNQWALPGLRMYKGESIDETLSRIAQQELGINLDVSKKVLLGQYVGKFKTEQQRQDLSTGYYFKVSPQTVMDINLDHFSTHMITREIPSSTGAMYKFYLAKAKERFEI